MSAKHTPGPWDLNHGVEITMTDAPFSVIATISEWLPEFEDERDANARLIAAAPRMFAIIEKGAAAGDAECVSIVEAVNGRAAATGESGA